MDQSTPQDIQALVQDLQLSRNQIQTVSTQINEITLTLESLSKQDKNRPVFRAVGNLLLEVDDRDELVKELSASKETFESHLERMVERENELRAQYDSVVSSLE
ncbi:MAG: prefoldin subunit [Candidatus Thalassarchaeaceae archaeon]|nr:prefoldin subunit [Candidatus Thalassarchaeaceae archaeon]|tara:strand:+ start:1252 stop:1563 length:312 start_codon:yes stop_codon:yes gene_type:complete